MCTGKWGEMICCRWKGIGTKRSNPTYRRDFSNRLKIRMKALVIIEKDQNGYGAYTDNLTTVLHGSGASVQEAKDELMAGYQDLLAYYNESGETVPDELEDLTFEYRYDISAMFNVFDFLNASKFAEKIGISPSLMRHYKRGDTYISQKQAKKIESGLHKIGQEFLSFTL